MRKRDLAVDAVCKLEEHHVEAEALEVPPVLCEGHVSPLVEQRTPASPQRFILLFARDHVDVDVRALAGGVARERPAEERGQDERLALAERAEPCDRGQAALSLRECLPRGVLDDRHEAALTARAEGDGAFTDSEDRVVATDQRAGARAELRAALADDDVAGLRRLAV